MAGTGFTSGSDGAMPQIVKTDADAVVLDTGIATEDVLCFHDLRHRAIRA